MTPFALDAVDQYRQKDYDPQNRLIEVTINLHDCDEVFDDHDRNRRQEYAEHLDLATVKARSTQYASRHAFKGVIAKTAKRSLRRIGTDCEENRGESREDTGDGERKNLRFARVQACHARCVRIQARREKCATKDRLLINNRNQNHQYSP